MFRIISVFLNDKVIQKTTSDPSLEHDQCIHLARQDSKDIVGVAQYAVCRQFIALPKLTNR